MTDNDTPNRVYRLVWNACTGVWQAVSEVGRGKGRSTSSRRAARRLRVAAMVSLAASSAFAGEPLPSGGHVVAGSGSIAMSTNGLTIDQDSSRIAIDWASFNIGPGREVRFVQPSSDAVALNRVTGPDPSLIQGELSANGHVFLINPNGVMFTNTARVDVGGLTASTLGIANADFMAGRYRFGDADTTSANAVVNQGRITTTAGGTVALVAARIVNDGTIIARQGNVLMGAGSQVTLDFGGPVKVRVDKGALDALIRNDGALLADGGVVYLSSRAVGDLVSTVINQTGTIEARTLATGRQGQIVLLGDMADGRVEIGGTLDASAPDGGQGGAIETSAASVKIAPDIRVTTAAPHGNAGNWLVDPYDIVVAASGGDVTGATLSAALNSTNVTLDTTSSTYGNPGVGTITVNDAITKTGGAGGQTTLTLLAHADINVNAPITSSGGRLNVVLTADQDNSGGGNVAFGPGGRVVTNGGNFYVGSVSGQWDTVTATAQDFTMATGAYVDVGQGRLDIEVQHNIVLPDNSARAVPWALHSAAATDRLYFDSGDTEYWWYLSNTSYGQAITLASTGGSIASANSVTTNADIVTGSNVFLNAGTIGTSGTPIRISGMNDIYGLAADPQWSSLTFPQVARTLFVTNYTGSSYVAEVGVQVLSSVVVQLAGQPNATQDITLMGDQGGTGHVHLHTDGSGVLNLASGDVSTGGVPGIAGSMYTVPQGTDPTVFPTSVNIYAPGITFANASVDTGAPVMYYAGGTGTGYKDQYGMSPYSASFTASAGSLASSQVDGVADIRAQVLTLDASALGTQALPVEIGAGQYLSLLNYGGSTFVKVVDDSFTHVSLDTVAQSGEHHVLWANGDHIDVVTDATGLLVPTLSGGRSDGSDFTATHGVDLSGGNRGMSFMTYQGALRFDTDSVDLGGGAFSAFAYGTNASGKAIYGVHPMDGAAEITAGDVSLTVDYGSGSAKSISDLEFAHGGTSTNNTLTLASYDGDISIAELSPDHFKNIYIELWGSDVAQHVQVALAGPDNIDLSDASGRVTLSANSVNLSSGNRNFLLDTDQRLVQIDGNSLGTGNYEVYAGAGLYLDGNVLTNGGAIFLAAGGAGIVAMRDVTIDANADNTGNTAHSGSAGIVALEGDLSASVAGAHVSVDARSSNGTGGTIEFISNAGDLGGHYLAGLTFDARGATPDQDGGVFLFGSSYLLNGSFASYGYTSLLSNGLAIDTEQGNVADAGSVTFGGAGLNTNPNGTYAFDTSTTAVGKNGGNVVLSGVGQRGANSLQALTVDAAGGAGGQAGDVFLGGLDTTAFRGNGAIDVTGRTIVLGGNLSTNQSDVTLDGDVELATDVTVKTWSDTGNVAAAHAGSVMIAGALGATSANRTLTIDTSTDTGSDWADAPANVIPFTQGAGSVTISSGTTRGIRLGGLVVDTSTTGLHNLGANGAISASGVATTGNQSYTGGTLAIAGNLTSGGTISVDLHDAGTTLGGAGIITADALAITGNDTTVDLTAGGVGNRVGTLAISGAAGVRFLDNDVALTIGDAGGISGIAATGTISVATRSANLTVASDVTTSDASSAAVVLEAGQSAAAGTAAGGDVVIAGTPSITTGAGGRFTIYTGSLTGSTGLGTLVQGGHYRYDSDSATSHFTTALGTGGYAIYREQPRLEVTASASKIYDGRAFLGGHYDITGFVNGDTRAILTGSLGYGGTSQGAIDAGTYTLLTSGLANGLGYAIVHDAGSLTVAKATLTITGNDVTKNFDGRAFSGGDGVRYAGFARGDDAANSLGGTLAYGGSAQGAIGLGDYGIDLSGLTASNYDIRYVDGMLHITGVPAPAVAAITQVQGAVIPFRGGFAGSSVVPINASVSEPTGGAAAGLRFVHVTDAGASSFASLSVIDSTPGLLDFYVVDGGLNLGGPAQALPGRDKSREASR